MMEGGVMFGNIFEADIQVGGDADTLVEVYTDGDDKEETEVWKIAWNNSIRIPGHFARRILEPLRVDELGPKRACVVSLEGPRPGRYTTNIWVVYNDGKQFTLVEGRKL
jgi:hypothetical protein